jgi:transposase-like protein
MMAEPRQPSTAEFKREAVRLMTVHGYGVAEAARHFRDQRCDARALDTRI